MASHHESRGTQGEYPVFVSLGMIVLDEIRFASSHTLYDVPGGSGLYATFGSRLFETGMRSARVGCVVLAGCDFPENLLRRLQSWGITLAVHEMSGKPSTRGLLEYEDDAFGRKSFTYVNPPLQPLPAHIEHCDLLWSRSFHFLAPPEDLEVQLGALLGLREQHGITERPMIVWEPAPYGCDFVNLACHLRACALVDVFSPNHLELGYLVDGKLAKDPEFSKSAVELSARKFLDSGVGNGKPGIVVIRCGEHGVLTMSSLGAEWLPPYYDRLCSKVVDPTGVGNAFLGGFTVSLLETHDPREASIRGSVASSYALEQFSVPSLAPDSWLSKETWNESSVLRRVEEFNGRLSKV
ncbi:Ribokinase-like protein [Hypoxylon sp. FL0543]|nr:Ribokinase-like protein [Hypoxylon sp. FL0543]